VEYSDNPYGDNFADIYDEWYRDLDNIDEVVALVLSLAENGSVYELGIGTGRLALPIALAGESSGVHVSGIDSSQAMLDQLAAKPRAELIDAQLGHMVRDMAPGPFSVVLLAYNTLFNLLSARTARVPHSMRQVISHWRPHHCRLLRTKRRHAGAQWTNSSSQFITWLHHQRSAREQNAAIN
jgi:SAM-dependent methyltransferase